MSKLSIITINFNKVEGLQPKMESAFESNIKVLSMFKAFCLF
jgi:hypothetical protein